MTSNPFHSNLDNVTDPGDWKNTKLPVLAELDSLNRCYICKEFFHAPVTTSCNHTFCSQCIREYLVSSSRCPLCNVELFESNLRRDLLLEQIASCFSSVRPYLLDLLKKVTPDPEPIAVGLSNPVPSSSGEVIDITDEESPKRSSSPGEVSNKRVKLDPDHDLVECPVCGKSMSESFLQSRHIDDCLSGKPTAPYVPRKRPSTKSSISSFFRSSPKSNNFTPSRPASSSPPTYLGNRDFYFKDVHKHNAETKKLSKLDFSSLTTPKLKEKLAGLKLSTAGTRVQLELRYNQYYVLYNSNLDSSKPVDKKILRQNLNKWEQSHSAFRSTNADLFAGRGSLSNKSITDKNFSVQQWNEVYNHDFKNLIREAKKSRKPKAQSTEADCSIQEMEDAEPSPASVPTTGDCAQHTTMPHHAQKPQDKHPNQNISNDTNPVNGSIGSQAQT